MTRESKEARHARIHEEALREFNDIAGALWEERQMNRDDRRFAIVAGAMYEGRFGQMFENKPKIEINKILKAALKVTSAYRNNQMTIKFETKDGSEIGKLATTCDGLYRADEKDSNAQEAFMAAFDEALHGGFGAYRVRNILEDELDPDNERQRIVFEAITDADQSVFFDLDARKQDKSDAKRCFVLHSMTRAAYKAQWGDDPADWPQITLSRNFDWVSPDFVYCAEYYRVETESVTVRDYALIGGEKQQIVLEDVDDSEIADIEAISDLALTKERKMKRRKVCKYYMNGNRVLEDFGRIAGDNIPIVPVYGMRWVIDGVERCQGIVRLAKDPARLKNMQVSRLAEIAAMSPIEKPIFTPEQVAGHELRWAQDNIENYPYMLANALVDAQGNPMPAGAVGYTKPPQLPPALVGLLQQTEADLQDILGANPGQEKMVSNISGKAVELIQERIDESAFIYIQNMSQARLRDATIWLSQAKDAYTDTDGKMKVVDALGGSSFIALDEMEIVDGKPVRAHDLRRAKMEVSVSVGPATSSRRQSTIRELMNLIAITEDPEDKGVLNAMVMLNMEGEGINEIRNYYRRKLVTQGIIEPTDEEKEQMAQAAQQQAKPDPQASYLLAQAEKALADAEKARADAQKTAAEASPEQQIIKANAEVERARLEIERQEQANAFEREKQQMALEMQLLKLAEQRQSMEMQLQIEAVKAQGQIDTAGATAKAMSDDALKSDVVVV